MMTSQIILKYYYVQIISVLILLSEGGQSAPQNYPANYDRRLKPGGFGGTWGTGNGGKPIQGGNPLYPSSIGNPGFTGTYIQDPLFQCVMHPWYNTGNYGAQPLILACQVFSMSTPPLLAPVGRQATESGSWGYSGGPSHVTAVEPLSSGSCSSGRPNCYVDENYECVC